MLGLSELTFRVAFVNIEDASVIPDGGYYFCLSKDCPVEYSVTFKDDNVKLSGNYRLIYPTDVYPYPDYVVLFIYETYSDFLSNEIQWLRAIGND